MSKMSLRKIVLAEFAAHARSFEDEQKIFKFEVSRFIPFQYWGITKTRIFANSISLKYYRKITDNIYTTRKRFFEFPRSKLSDLRTFIIFLNLTWEDSWARRKFDMRATYKLGLGSRHILPPVFPFFQHGNFPSCF